MEWQYDWDLQGRLPLQIELVMAIGAKGEEIRQVFWVPAKQSPEVRMRQMVQNPGATGGGGGGGGGGGRGNNNGGGGGGGNPPPIQIPQR